MSNPERKKYACGICNETGHTARSQKYHPTESGEGSPAQSGEIDQESDVIRALKRENGELKKKIQKQETVKNLFKMAVSESLEDLPRIEIPRKAFKAKTSAPEETAVLHVSDTQIGKVTPTYNSDVAEERLLELAEKTIEITNVRRSAANIDDLHLYLGGDIVEGEDIFPSQPHQIDQSVFDQAIRTSPNILAKMTLRLLEEFPRVHITTVPGNHGRNGRFGAGQHPRTNWDNACYDVLKAMLLGPEGKERKELDGRLNFNISETWYALDHIYDWTSLVVHGDQITGGFAGFPWYGVTKKLAGWIDVIPEPFTYVWAGHWHTPVMATFNHRIFLGNGTTESDNEYAAASLAAGGYPCQRLGFFNKKHGLISDDLIYLTSDRKPPSFK